MRIREVGRQRSLRRQRRSRIRDIPKASSHLWPKAPPARALTIVTRLAGWRGSVAAGASAIQGIGFCLEVATGVEEEKSYSSSLKLPRARDPDSCAACKPGDPGVLPHHHTCRTRLIAGFAGVSVITFEIAVFARDQAPASAVFCLQNAEEADLGVEAPWSAAISMRACALARNSGP